MKTTLTKNLPWRDRRSLLGIALLYCLALSEAQAQDWSTATSSNAGRIESQSVVYNEKMYVFAGFYKPWSVTRSAEFYDPVRNRWTALPLSPQALTHQGIALVDQTVWLVGGFTSANPKIPRKEVYLFDIPTSTWSQGPSLPVVRSSLAMARLGRKLHVFGGLVADMETDTGEHWVLDLDNQDQGWVPAAPLPFPRNHLSAAVVEGRIYAIGGQNGHDVSRTFLRYVHAYDPLTDTWTRKADLPSARSHFESGTAVHDGKIIIAGGVGPSGNLNRVTEYDPQANTWKELPVLAQSLLAPNAKVINGQLIVSNGFYNNEALKTTRIRPVVGTGPDKLGFYPQQLARTLAPNTAEASTAFLWTLNKPVAYTIDTGSLPAWLQVTRPTGTADQAASAVGITLKTAGLQPGRYTYTLTASAPGYPNAMLPVTVDVTGTVPPNAAPTVRLTSPTSQSTHAAGTTLALLAAASDADGTINKVAFFSGTTKLGDIFSSPFEYKWTNIPAGTYTLTAQATDNTGATTTSDPVQISVSPPPASDLVYRINVGGGAVAAEGLDWSAHGGGSGPFLSNGQGVSSRAFLGANATGAPDALFSSFRFDAGSAGDPLSSEMRWALPVAAGTYRVRLFFADTYAGTQAPGRRVFDVLAEGRPALTGLDVYAAGGPDAVVRELTVPVADGALNLDFLHRVENPLLSAIEVRRAGGEAACAASGTILREAWQNVGGRSVSSIPLHTAPTSTSQLAQFEGPRGAGDNYGSRIRGYLCAPATGQYTFWIAGDDDCELWLSTDDDPANKTRIAHFSGSTGFREWGKFATQQSAPVTLTAGKRYYVEALHKEGGGGDHVSVGWQLPDGALERPIQGNRLSPFAPAAAASAGGLARGLGAREARAYPNPFRNTIRLSLSGAWGTELTVTLLDPLGREAFRGSVPAEGSPADLEIGPEGARLPGGVYFLRLQGSDGTRQTIKLLKLP